MARGMALAGVDPSELLPPEPPKEPEGVEAKWKNIWYHHKPFILIGGFTLLVALIFLHQMIVKDPPDYTVTVVTEIAMYAPEQEALEQYIAAAGQDLDGDGKVEVTIENLTPNYYSDVAPQAGQADRQKLISSLSTGDTMLYVFDRPSYDDFMTTISEVTTDDYMFFAPLDTTSKSYDSQEHYWDWVDDPNRTIDAFAELPEHMLFGVRTAQGTASRNNSAQMYEDGKVLLETLADRASVN